MNVPLFAAVVVLYAATSAYGLYLIKDAHALLSARAVIGGALYAGGFCIWLVMLRFFPLSVAFPVAAGSLIVATHLFARFSLHESVSSAQTLGIAMILVGIFLVFPRTA